MNERNWTKVLRLKKTTRASLKEKNNSRQCNEQVGTEQR